MDAKTSTLVLLFMSFLDHLDAYVSAAEGDEAFDQSLRVREAHGKQQEGGVLSAAMNDGLLAGVPEHFTGPRVYWHWTSAAAKHVTNVEILEESLGVAGGGSDGGHPGEAATDAAPKTSEALRDRSRVLELQSSHTPTTESAMYTGGAFFTIFSVNKALSFIYLKASSLCHRSLGLASRHPRVSLLRLSHETHSVAAAAAGAPPPRTVAGPPPGSAQNVSVGGAAQPRRVGASQSKINTARIPSRWPSCRRIRRSRTCTVCGRSWRGGTA